MPYYPITGDVPPKRHTQHKGPDGRLRYEELMGEEGFSSDSSLLYHRHIPSAVIAAEPWDLPSQELSPNHPLLPRHLRTHDLAAGDERRERDTVTGRRLLLGNAQVRIAYAVAGRHSPLYRNAEGDECVYVESGEGVVETVFGELPFRQGDYVVIPRATTHRGCHGAANRSAPTSSSPRRTSPRPATICPNAGSCWSTPRTANATCTDRRSRCGPRARKWTCTSSTAGRRAPRGRATPTPTTRSTWWAGTAACIRTPSTSPTSSRSPAASTNRRPPTRSSRARASSSATSFPARSTTTRWPSPCRTTTQRGLRRGHVLLRRQLRGP